MINEGREIDGWGDLPPLAIRSESLVWNRECHAISLASRKGKAVFQQSQWLHINTDIISSRGHKPKEVRWRSSWCSSINCQKPRWAIRIAWSCGSIDVERRRLLLLDNQENSLTSERFQNFPLFFVISLFAIKSPTFIFTNETNSPYHPLPAFNLDLIPDNATLKCWELFRQQVYSNKGSRQRIQKVKRSLNQIYVALVTGGKITPIGGRQYTAWVLVRIILLTFSL